MINAKPLTKDHLPQKILAIRMQAMGDVVITMPYLQELRNNLPASTEIDFLTRQETDPIPKNLVLFNNIFSIGGKRSLKKQFIAASFLLPKLLLRRYDMVIDLQNNILSRFIRKILMPSSWVEFDKLSPLPAGERTMNTIEAIGLGKYQTAKKLFLKNDLNAKKILLENGWNENNKLVVLNPAGAFETRNWPLENYSSFARLWVNEYPNTQFLMLGLSNISFKAVQLKKELKEQLIDLTGITNVAEAFSIIQYSSIMITEDSGLMHMAWTTGIPVFALLGSTRSDWSRPLGENSDFVDSSDLECGNCMLEKCKWGDNRCMTRYSPEFVFEKTKKLFSKSQ